MLIYAKAMGIDGKLYKWYFDADLDKHYILDINNWDKNEIVIQTLEIPFHVSEEKEYYFSSEMTPEQIKTLSCNVRKPYVSAIIEGKGETKRVEWELLKIGNRFFINSNWKEIEINPFSIRNYTWFETNGQKIFSNDRWFIDTDNIYVDIFLLYTPEKEFVYCIDDGNMLFPLEDALNHESSLNYLQHFVKNWKKL